MNFGRSRVKEDPEMNLIPLIDVLLVIIIFLMLTTTYSRFAELQINLPTADAEKQADRANEISIVVSAAGQYFIGKTPVAARDAGGLSAEMRRVGATMKDPVVIINADAATTHQSVITVMQAAQQAGYGQISFATQTGK
ncbi:MAG: biopolymer transporter ExbD [Proteobacteria bacterium]|nr:biopolymer transporter ExbD [Pseudomonadota bacterium]